jgi:tRNA(Ile)-lysidine synthase
MRGKRGCANSVRSETHNASFSLRAVLDAHLPAGVTALVVGLSGGADSAALLALAAASGAEFRGRLRAVHIDHGLQIAAASFREACTAACTALAIPLSIIAVTLESSGSSVEAAARDARYAALEAELRPGECLLTAHHREDQAETLLLQALRGAGLRGMSAMPICRRFGCGWHLRPLLGMSQSELLKHGASLQGAYFLDPMNHDLRIDRSYLRQQIWPSLKARWPGAASALSRSARHAAQAQVLLDRAAAAELVRLRDGDALSVQGLRALDSQQRINVLRFWLNAAGAEAPPTSRLLEALRQIFDAETDHLPSVAWGRHALRRYRQRVFLTASHPPQLLGTQQWPRAAGSRVDLGPGLGALSWVSQNGGIDVQRLPATLSVRRRRGGETLKPAAKAKTTSVQHLCQLQGVLPWMRDALPLVFAGDVLIAVADLWVDARWCAAPSKPGAAIVWERAPIIG